MTPPFRRLLPFAAATLLLLAAAPSAFAGDAAGCRRENPEPRAFLDCLTLLQKEGEQALQRSIKGVEAAIEARADLHPSQRRRWLGLFQESQGRFVHWRNFECQSIAPFEGEPRPSVGGRLGGAGVIEQRLVCLISHNERRARDLEARYAPDGGWPPALPAPPEAATEAAAPATPASAPTGVPRIIDMNP